MISHCVILIFDDKSLVFIYMVLKKVKMLSSTLDRILPEIALCDNVFCRPELCVGVGRFAIGPRTKIPNLDSFRFGLFV